MARDGSTNLRYEPAETSRKRIPRHDWLKAEVGGPTGRMPVSRSMSGPNLEHYCKRTCHGASKHREASIAGGDKRAYGVATRLSQPPRWGCRARSASLSRRQLDDSRNASLRLRPRRVRVPKGDGRFHHRHARALRHRPMPFMSHDSNAGIVPRV